MVSCHYYDPSNKDWLDLQPSSMVSKRTSALSTNCEINSILAYNLGTYLSRNNNLKLGTEYLISAIEMGYPLEEATRNVMTNYYKQNQHLKVIQFFENSTVRSYEIERLNFYSLIQLGRKEKAVRSAMRIIAYPVQQPDFYHLPLLFGKQRFPYRFK